MCRNTHCSSAVLATVYTAVRLWYFRKWHFPICFHACHRSSPRIFDLRVWGSGNTMYPLHRLKRSTSALDIEHLKAWRDVWGHRDYKSRSFWSFGICGRWKQSMGATPTVVVTNVVKVCFIHITSTLLGSPNLGFATSDGRYQPTVDFDKWGSI